MYWLWFEAWEHLLLTAWGWSKESLAQERVMMVLHCTARILHASWEPRLGIRILSLSRDAPGWAIGLGHRGTSRHWLWEIWAHMWSVSASRCLNLRSLGALAAAISYPMKFANLKYSNGHPLLPTFWDLWHSPLRVMWCVGRGFPNSNPQSDPQCANALRFDLSSTVQTCA